MADSEDRPRSAHKIANQMPVVSPCALSDCEDATVLPIRAALLRLLGAIIVVYELQHMYIATNQWVMHYALVVSDCII